jgi:hypothetical protein
MRRTAAIDYPLDRVQALEALAFNEKQADAAMWLALGPDRRRPLELPMTMPATRISE